MNRKLNIDPKKAAIRKRNIRVYNDNLRIILKEGGNYYSDNGKFGIINEMECCKMTPLCMTSHSR